MKRIMVLSVAALMLAACTSDQVTSTLEATVDAAIAADSIAHPQDAAYLAIATNCLDQAETILESAVSTQLKAADISAACAAAVAAGQSNTGVAAVSAALNAFLKAVTNTASAVLILPHPEMVDGFAEAAKPHALDKAKLKKIRAKIEKLKSAQKAHAK